ncbi:MAG: 16S rRNA (cytidine(1402)-2'-O)-methyltransferase [Pseudomonadota bacterium]
MADPTQKGGGAAAREDDAAEPSAPARPRALAPGLHFIATPIGAADDITLRSLAALRQADALACEDTRSFRRLLDLHGVSLAGRPLIAYHDHNAESARPKILARLAAGESVVYAAEAGTPLIADPGFKLAAAARGAGAAVSALPGPSAAITALILSGMPTDAFAFIGFLPAKPAARRRVLARWRDAPASLVLFEAPHRLPESLADMAEEFGADRPAALARELTKRHEEIARGALSALAARFADEGPPKGELAIVIAPPAPKEIDEREIEARLAPLLATESVKDAVRTVVERLGAPRKMVYAVALKMTRDKHPSPDHS